MDVDQLRHFIAVADEGHLSRAANAAHVSRATIQASVEALEGETGLVLVATDDTAGADPGSLRLTAAGLEFLPAARARAAQAAPPARNAGGKAKASKGRGRAPVVKGEPKPFKKRQGR